jgi:hypothetical protein
MLRVYVVMVCWLKVNRHRRKRMEELGLFLCLCPFLRRDGGLDDVLGGVVELTS